MAKTNKRYFLTLLISAILISGCVNDAIPNDVPKEPIKLELRKPTLIDDVLVMFGSVKFVNKIEGTEAEKGYNFVVISVTAKNEGFESNKFPFSWILKSNKVLKVDKGYLYEDKYSFTHDPSLMRPTELKRGHIVFEILEDTYPAELYLERVIDTTDCLMAYEYGYLSMKEDTKKIKDLRRECIDKYVLQIDSTPEYDAVPQQEIGKPEVELFLSESQIELQMADFIENLVPPGVSVAITGVSSEKGLYKIEVALESDEQEEEIVSYVTQDGELFFTQAINVVQVQEIGKPEVELFLSESQIELQMADFIENLVPPGVSVAITGVSSEKGLYKIEVALESEGDEQEITSYVTQDGELFFTQALNVTQITADMEAQPPAQTETPSEAIKSETPSVELFVMSFCPYGVMAEDVMRPVVDLLGDTMDLNIRFIVYVEGDTPDSVGSLHGAPEAQENMRQACVANNYDTATFWTYLSDINANCYPIYRNAEAMESCWRAAAEKAGIDADMIAACANSTEAVDFMKADSALASMYGVRGSPTLIINGEVSSAPRTPDGYKEAICSAFTTAPYMC